MTAESMVELLLDRYGELIRKNNETERAKRDLREKLQSVVDLCDTTISKGSTTPDVQLALHIREILK